MRFSNRSRPAPLALELGAATPGRLRRTPLARNRALATAIALPQPSVLPPGLGGEATFAPVTSPARWPITKGAVRGRWLLAAASRLHYAFALFLTLHGGPVVVLGIAAMVGAEIAAARGHAHSRLHTLGVALYLAIFSFGFTCWIQAYWGVVDFAWLAVAVTFAAATWVSIQQRRGARWVLAAMVVLVDYALATTGRAALPAEVAVVAAVMIVAGAARPDGLDHLRPWHASLSVAAALLATPVAVFYLRDETPAMARIGMQPGVRPLIPFASHEGSARDLGHAQIYGVTPGCRAGVLYLTARWGQSGIFEYHQATGDGRWIGEFSAADNTQLDCEAGRLYAGDANDAQIVQFDLAGEWATQMARMPLSTPMPLQLALVPDRGGLLVSTDRYALHWLDVADGSERDVIENTGKYFAYANGRVYVIRHDVQVFEVDAEAGRLRQVARWPLPKIADRGSVVVDSGRGRLFATTYENGEVLELDLTTGAQVSSTFLARALRFLRESPDGRWLVAADFLHGELFVVDPDRMQVVKRIEVGPRARGVTFSRDGHTAYVASGAGAFAIELPDSGAASAIAAGDEPPRTARHS